MIWDFPWCVIELIKSGNDMNFVGKDTFFTKREVLRYIEENKCIKVIIFEEASESCFDFLPITSMHIYLGLLRRVDNECHLCGNKDFNL